MWDYKDTPVIREGDRVEIDFATGVTTIDRKLPKTGPFMVKSGTGSYTMCGTSRTRAYTSEVADWLINKLSQRKK